MVGYKGCNNMLSYVERWGITISISWITLSQQSQILPGMPCSINICFHVLEHHASRWCERNLHVPLRCNYSDHDLNKEQQHLINILNQGQNQWIKTTLSLPQWLNVAKRNLQKVFWVIPNMMCAFDSNFHISRIIKYEAPGRVLWYRTKE